MRHSKREPHIPRFYIPLASTPSRAPRGSPTPPTTHSPRTLPTPSSNPRSPLTPPLNPRPPQRPPRTRIPIHNLPIRPRHKERSRILRARRCFVRAARARACPGSRASWREKFGLRGGDDEARGVELVFEGGVVGGEEFGLEAAARLGDCLVGRGLVVTFLLARACVTCRLCVVLAG